MAEIDPAQAWLALGEHMREGTVPPPEVRAYVVRAVRASLDGVPVDLALQLRPGASAKARRNHALRAAAQLLDNDPRRLAEAVIRYPRMRSTGAALERHLGDAFATGWKVPTSTKQLRRIIRDI
ncbi:hypothetical protein [Thiorhodococcus minor]|uniref:Uncharacterized protein n=1 Tax=Thiorhodococcus minor TaxID=57489 RepID=A0A6M0JXK9_9GAMM|nr:hypothetical protein [Thiorhodococcus minor]NEV62262.1 hypothetical protein [Thiorhodococcus minor]